MRRGVYQSTTHIAVVLLLLILFVTAGYFVLIPAPDSSSRSDAMLAGLERNRENWENNRPLSFRYVVRRSCFCESVVEAGYVAMERRGQKTAAFQVPVESGSGEFLDAPPNPVWIDDIFRELLAAMDVNPRPVIDIRYDARYSFPASVNIQYTQRDIYVGYDLQDFEVLEHR